MSSAQKTLGMSMKRSSIFLWNIFPVGAASNGSIVYLYLPNEQENVIKYDDFSLSFSLQYPELMSISMRYLTPASLRSMSFSVEPLLIGLINTLFLHAGSRQCHFPNCF